MGLLFKNVTLDIHKKKWNFNQMIATLSRFLYSSEANQVSLGSCSLGVRMYVTTRYSPASILPTLLVWIFALKCGESNQKVKVKNKYFLIMYCTKILRNKNDQIILTFMYLFWMISRFCRFIITKKMEILGIHS